MSYSFLCTFHCPKRYTHDFKAMTIFSFILSEECDDQSFGEECRKQCGNCYDDTSCDHITGECPGECKDGWLGSFCNESEKNKIKKIPCVIYVVT